MITVNSLSGGKTSSYMAVHFPANVEIFACVCIDYVPAKPKDPTVLQYALNKLQGNFIATAESDKTLKVMMDLEQILGKEIVWVRGKSFDEVIDSAGVLPSWSKRFCTYELKLVPIFEYCFFRYGVVNERIGFRYDEYGRAFDKQGVLKIEATVERYPIASNVFGMRRQKLRDYHFANKSYPLIENKIFQIDVLSYWAKCHPEVIFPSNSNCLGCHHKPPELIALNYREEPEKLIWFSLQEKKKRRRRNDECYLTWHDDRIPYSQKFTMNFTEEIDFENFTMCNSGQCTD